MKMSLLAGVIALFLTGCDSGDKFDGEYSCQISKYSNEQSLKSGVKFFPPGVERVRVVVKNKVFTVYGLNDGEYISSTMKKATDSDKKGLSEEEKELARDAMINRRQDGIDAFSPGLKLFTFTGVVDGKKYGHQLTDCEKKS